MGSQFYALRVSAELAAALDTAIAVSGQTKTEWLTEAIVLKLGLDTPENRLAAVASRLEDITAQLDRQTSQNAPERVTAPQKRKPMPTQRETRREASGEISEAQQAIIRLDGEYRAEGLPKIDILIADELNRQDITTPTGTPWTNRTVQNTKTRLRRRGLIN